jgi:hypothetical protein
VAATMGDNDLLDELTGLDREPTAKEPVRRYVETLLVKGRI